jgi:hypothetical protein
MKNYPPESKADAVALYESRPEATIRSVAADLRINPETLRNWVRVAGVVGDSETEIFRSEFLRSPRERGLSGVRLVISNSHSGLVKAIRKVMIGAGWQRCRVHFVRNVFAVIPKGSAEMVAATIRTVFTQPTADAVRAQLDTVADMLGQQFPKAKEMLLGAKEDLTAFADFPDQHWKKIESTNRHCRMISYTTPRDMTPARTTGHGRWSGYGGPSGGSRFWTSGSHRHDHRGISRWRPLKWCNRSAGTNGGKQTPHGASQGAWAASRSYRPSLRPASDRKGAGRPALAVERLRLRSQPGPTGGAA